MYLLTKSGAYSINRKGQKIVILTRTRTAMDALATLGRVPLKIKSTPHGDYTYRTTLSDELAKHLAGCLIQEIDYDNFKASLQGSPLEDAYLQVWLVLKMDSRPE